MKKLYTLLTILMAATAAYAQPNLVPNGSFEQFTTCPTGLSQVTNAVGWYSYNGGTPDYFNVCGTGTVSIPANFAGNETPAHGNAYLGAYTNVSSRELAACAITPMVVGATYEVSMSVSKAETYTGNTNDLGVYFFQNGVLSFTGLGTITATPQVSYSSYGIISQTNGWTRLTKTFVADSPYHHMVVGCFSATPLLSPTGTTYYYMDSIVVKLLNGMSIGTIPTAFCRGDVIQVPFTILNSGNFYQPSNVFTLQLSDAAGNFTVPTNIGTLPGNAAGNITGTIPMALPAGTGYRLRIVSSVGADTSLPSVPLSIGNIVPVKPIANANTPLCTSSGDLMLTASTTTPGVTWSWTGPMSFTSTLQNPSITTPGTLQSGDYIVEANIYGCKSEKDTVTVVVNQLPAAIISTSNTPVCSGQSITLGSSSSSPGVTWSWVGPQGVVATTQAAVIPNSTIPMSGNYTVSATQNGCTVSSTVTVEVKPTPAFTATSNSPVCEGATISLSAISNDPNVVNYQWTGPLSYLSGVSSPTILSATLPMGGIYTATATLNGCSRSITVPVIVNPMPAVPVLGSNSPACDVLTLTATGVPGTTYNWTGPAGFSSTQQNPTISNATPGNNGIYTVVASIGSCVQSPVTIQATVNPKPYLGAYASPNDTVCDGTVVTFVTVPMNGIVNPVFQWFKNGVEIPGATALTYVGAYTTGDEFYCRTYAQDLCNNNITLFSNKITMHVISVINPLSASISSTPAIPQPGQPIDFMCTVVSGGYTPQFQWRKNGQDVFGAITANWSANNLAPYDEISCKVTTSDPCAQPKEVIAQTVVVNFPTAIGSIDAGNGIALYPNPNKGSFTVKSTRHKIKQLEVVNSIGQRVYDHTTPGYELNITLPASLANGVYIIKLDTEAGIMQQRFTLQR